MSANKSESKSEDVESDEESDFEVDQPKTKVTVLFQEPSKGICWNKKGKDKLRGACRKGWISLLRRQKVATQRLEKERLNT